MAEHEMRGPVARVRALDLPSADAPCAGMSRTRPRTKTPAKRPASQLRAASAHITSLYPRAACWPSTSQSSSPSCRQSLSTSPKKRNSRRFAGPGSCSLGGVVPREAAGDITLGSYRKNMADDSYSPCEVHPCRTWNLRIVMGRVGCSWLCTSDGMIL